MSSHREAPEISKDQVADNTDVYAFVSPDQPDTVTLIANFIPFQLPDAGPNFYEFGEDVAYNIHINNTGDGTSNITYQFLFQTETRNLETFLYNTGPITSLDSMNWNRRQFYTVTKVVNGAPTLLAQGLISPPCNIGPRSTPNYAALAQAAVHKLPSGETVFAGQRAEGFYVDLGAVFDLADLRPFQHLHLIPSADAPGVNGTASVNVSTIAIQVPKTQLTRDGANPSDPMNPKAVIGIYASASRNSVRVREPRGQNVDIGPWVQVSRLANPLFNEVMIPLGKKDLWNSLPPSQDDQFLANAQHPELSKLLPVLYPNVFPNLAALSAARADIVAIFLTGLPAGVVPGFQNYSGPKMAEMMRLNMAIPPSATPNILGILGGDLAGFPNGRRVQDDVVTIELRALAGATYPLIDKTFKPDAAASGVTDGVGPTNVPSGYLPTFPYLGVPYDGYSHPGSNPTM